FKIARDGTVTTIFGPHRNRAILTVNPEIASEDDVEAIMSNIGTYTAGVSELNGANDLCFDPRDHNILYVACQHEHWIAKITLTTLVATVYAGTPGPTGNGYVDGAA